MISSLPNNFKTRKVRAGALALLFIVIAGVAALALWQRQQNSDPFRADAITDPPFDSLTYGIHAFLWWDEGPANLHIAWIDLMSFTHIRQIFAWEDIQPEPGVWRWDEGDRMMDQIEQAGLHVVARLGVTPDWAHPQLPPREETDTYVDAPPQDLNLWTDYCRAVAERYSGRIMAYQIWNEPNLSREWGGLEPNAADFVAMLRVCSEAIREEDPEAVIISPGLSPTGTYGLLAHPDDIFLQEMYDEGFQQYVDVVGAHTPGFTVPDYSPDEAETEGNGRWATFRRIEDLREIMVANGDAAKQMAILEVGYTTDQLNTDYLWFSVTEEQQAEYLAEAYHYAAENWRPWVGLMSAIYIARPTWIPENEEYWWALNDPLTGRMRPVFGALAQMEKFCGEDYIPARTPQGSATALEFNPCL